jgi:hypothetical protein
MVIAEAGVILLGPELATAELETAATLKDYELPFGFMVLDWGAVIVEDLTAQATDAVLKIQRLDKTGGTVTDIASLTIGNSNTNLKKGDGVKEAQTAVSVDADILNGHVVYGPRSTMPAFVSNTATILRIAVTTGSTGAGGAIVPFVFIKPILDARSAKVWIDVG